MAERPKMQSEFERMKENVETPLDAIEICNIGNYDHPELVVNADHEELALAFINKGHDLAALWFLSRPNYCHELWTCRVCKRNTEVAKGYMPDGVAIVDHDKNCVWNALQPLFGYKEVAE